MVAVTEQEWLISEDPGKMLRCLNQWHRDGHGSWTQQTFERKLRLFAEAAGPCVICRAIGSDTTCSELAWADYVAGSPCLPLADKAVILRDIIGNLWWPVKFDNCNRCDGTGKAIGSDRPFEWTPEVGYPGPCPVCKGFRFESPPWLTPAVLEMARTIDEGKECERGKGCGHRSPGAVSQECCHCHGSGWQSCWDTMPLLGDALEEAGCTCEEILNHCRGLERCTINYGKGHHKTPEQFTSIPKWTCELCHGTEWIPLRGPHVRGCWVIDLILGL